MYSLGDKYDIPNLRDLATTQLASALDDKTTPQEDLLEAIPIVYECTLETDRRIRDVVVLSARARRAKILEDTTLKTQLADVFRSAPGFSMDMLASLTTEPVLLKCHSCVSKQSLDISEQCCGCGRGLYASEAY